MAEVVLGVVASGFAVASLALQLVNAIQTLQAFCHSCGESNSNVERIKDHLTTLQAISATVAEACEEDPQIKCAESVINSLSACKARTEKLNDLMRSIGGNIHSGPWVKRWRTVRKVLREKTMQKIENQLRGDVIMLLLSLQPFFQ
jgi:chromosome condensin MukBEF ATPase and DNA-binding subunit MukB